MNLDRCQRSNIQRNSQRLTRDTSSVTLTIGSNFSTSASRDLSRSLPDDKRPASSKRSTAVEEPACSRSAFWTASPARLTSTSTVDFKSLRRSFTRIDPTGRSGSVCFGCDKFSSTETYRQNFRQLMEQVWQSHLHRLLRRTPRDQRARWWNDRCMN